MYEKMPTGIKDTKGIEIVEGDTVAVDSFTYNEETEQHDILHSTRIEGRVRFGKFKAGSNRGHGYSDDVFVWGWYIQEILFNTPLHEGVRVVEAPSEEG